MFLTTRESNQPIQIRIQVAYGDFFLGYRGIDSCIVLRSLVVKITGMCRRDMM